MFGAGQQQRSAAERDEDRPLSRRPSEASSSRQTTRADGRHSSASQQQQVQFHSFNENDDNEDDDDDDEDQRDPYNSKPNYRQYYYTSNEPEDRDDDEHHQRRYQYDELGEVPAAAAYDSMSTILEVDSEEANSSMGRSPGPGSLASERARELESPVEVRTTPTRRRHQPDDEPKAASRYDAGSPVGRISPEDKFGGALSALAAQMERLQRSVATNKSTDERLDVGGGQGATTSKQTPQKISAGGQSNWRSQAERLLDGGESQKQPPDGRHSADSLMMISISPIGVGPVESPVSPLTRPVKSSLPPLGATFRYRPEAEAEPERRVVEVANRSTMTSINLELMDKLLAKYYVEKRDKACQSIKFDCDLEDEFDIVEQQDGSSSLSRRSKALSSASRLANNPQGSQSLAQRSNAETMAKPQMKSVAIGTEKFARERFSLLPQTKTRSTQTGPNLSDSDHGISETRRFKLSSHLSGLSSLMRSSSSPSASSLTLADEEQVKVGHEKGPADESAAEGRESSSAERSQFEPDERTSRAAASPSAASTASDELVSTQTGNQNGHKLRTVSSGGQTKETANEVASAEQNQAQSDSSPKSTSQMSKESNQSSEAPAEAPLPAPEPAVESKKAPSLKTELRVIIEFADSRRKQRNELKSNAQLVDGKLSKRTEVSTSKQVAVSPRQVRDELELAGQRHSILLNPRHKRRDEWHEISKSTVCNEIETDTRESRRRSRDSPSGPETGASEANGGKREISDIVMSSEATIRQLASDQSAIDLRSRAAQRYASQWTAAADGKQAPEGERLLVESAAAFDESQLFESETNGADDDGGQMEVPQLNSAVKRDEATGRDDGPRASAPTGNADRLSPRAVALAAGLGPGPKATSPGAGAGGARTGRRVEANGGGQTTLMKVDDSRQQQQPTPSATERARAAASQRPHSPRYLSNPNLSEHHQSEQQQPPPPARSTSRFEFDERSEDRRQVTRNGRLVYDDRLREHHRYERRPAPLGAVNGERNVARAGREQAGAEQTTKSTPVPANKTPRGVGNNDLQVGGRHHTEQWRSQSQFNLDSRADYNKQRASDERRHQLENGTIVTRTGATAANNGQAQAKRLPAGGFSSPQINGRTSIGAQVEELAAGGQAQQTPARLRLSPALSRQTQLLRPIRLQTGEVGSPPPLVSPPNLFADHTSNLSHSDPETMDSGFVQSGAGSSNNINQLQQQLRPASRLARVQRAGRAGAQLADTSELDATAGPAEERAGGSLTFVDEDEEREDELLEQLGAGIGRQQQQQRPRLASGAQLQKGFGNIPFDGDQTNKSTTTKTLQQPPVGSGLARATSRPPLQPAADRRRLAQATPPRDRDLVTPPPAFRVGGGGGKQQTPNSHQTKTTIDLDQTELTTRLTRCKFNESRAAEANAKDEDAAPKRQRRRTLTKLDQNLVAPNFEWLLRERERLLLGNNQSEAARGRAHTDGSKGQRRRLLEACRFKAQVVFESDTDSAAERLSATGGRRSAASSLANRRRTGGGGQSSALNGDDKVKASEKQLITETKYSLTNGPDDRQDPAASQREQQWRAGPSELLAQKRPPLLQPNWDYSLRVNRMRGNKVDSRVSTHIKHSRQPAPNRPPGS